jgi:hypothetical protein
LGSKPKDSHYRYCVASKENLKFFKNKELGFLTGIAKNRSVSINGRDYTQIKNLEIPDEGLIVHLKKIGKVKVFCRTFINVDSRYYIMYLRDEDALLAITRTEFKALHSIHWGIECYHRAPRASLWYSKIHGESVGAGGFPAPWELAHTECMPTANP